MSGKNANNSTSIIANEIVASEFLQVPNYTAQTLPSATSCEFGDIVYNSSNGRFYGVSLGSVYQPITISAANLNNIISFSIAGNWTIPNGTYTTISSFETALQNTLLTTAFVEYSAVENKWKFKMKTGVQDIIQTVVGLNDNLSSVLGYGTSSLVSAIVFTPMPFTSNLFQNQQTFSEFALSTLPPGSYWQDAGNGNIQNANIGRVLIDTSTVQGNGSLQTSSLTIQNLGGAQGFVSNDAFGNLSSLAKVPLNLVEINQNLDMSGYSITGAFDVSSQKCIANNAYFSQGLFPNFLTYTTGSNFIRLNPNKSLTTSQITTDELVVDSNIVVNSPHHLRTNQDILNNQHDVVNRNALYAYSAPINAVLYLTGSTQNVQKMVQIWNATNPGSYNENLRLPETNGYSTIVMGDPTSNITGMTHDGWAFLRADSFYGKNFQIKNAGNIIASYSPTTNNFGYNISPSTTFKYNINPDLCLAEGNTNGALYYGSNAHYLRRDSGTNDLRLKTTSGNLYLEGTNVFIENGVITCKRVNSSSEGGQIELNMSDNLGLWYIDSHGTTSTQDLRIIRQNHNASAEVLFQIKNDGLVDVPSDLRVNGLFKPRVKARIKFTGGVYSIDSDYDNLNVSSVSSSSTGVITVNLAITLSPPYPNYQVSADSNSGVWNTVVQTNTTTLTVYGWYSNTLADNHSFFIVGM